MILKKLGDEYKLYSHDSCIATTYESPYKKLSLKNCQAIENGYDLMKLAEENSHKYYDVKTTDWHCNYNGFFSGFQKAVEILGDKKFSEDDIYNALDFARVSGKYRYEIILDDDFIQSLQQTQWEVEIEQELIQSSIEGEALWKTKLDSDNCLILKRK